MGKRTILIVWAVLAIAGAAGAASYIVVDQPELKNSVILFVDLFQQGRSQYLVGQDQAVYLREGETKTELIEGIPGRISALAVGDVTGDLKQNIVVGTDSAGAVYFYALRNNSWQRLGQPYYLWDTVRSLEIHDFNNDGWGDVAALTMSGEAVVLLSWEGKLYPFWRSPQGEVVTGLEVLYLSENGLPKIIYTLESGYVGILVWDDQEFITLWENYPWGLIESLVVLSTPERPEWLVVTSQKMLYGWSWRDGEVVPSRHFHASELGEHLFYLAGQGLLSFSYKTGMSLFELGSAGIRELWRMPGVFGSGVFYDQSEFIFRDSNFNYFRLVPGTEQWRIFVHEREVTSEVEVLELSGYLYYNLAQLAPELDFSVRPGEEWVFFKDGRFLTVDALENQVKFDELSLPVEGGALILREGMPFGQSSLLPLFGWRVEIDSARKRAKLVKNWGWWLE